MSTWPVGVEQYASAARCLANGFETTGPYHNPMNLKHLNRENRRGLHQGILKCHSMIGGTGATIQCALALKVTWWSRFFIVMEAPMRLRRKVIP